MQPHEFLHACYATLEDANRRLHASQLDDTGAMQWKLALTNKVAGALVGEIEVDTELDTTSAYMSSTLQGPLFLVLALLHWI